jgi:hypothetical protein
MLTAFFMLNRSFITSCARKTKQTANIQFYEEVNNRLITGVHCVRPEFQESWSWYLLNVSAPAHFLGIVYEFWAK